MLFCSRPVRRVSGRCRGCGSSSFDRGHTAICTGASHGFLAVFTGRSPRHASAAPGARRPPRDMLQARHARPAPKAIGPARPGGGGGSSQGPWVPSGVRMGPGVPPVGGCIFGCWRERPSRDIPADGTSVSVSKSAWKGVGSSRRKFDRANMWCAPIWEMENQDFPPHRTGKVARRMPASSIRHDLRRPPFPRAVSL